MKYETETVFVKKRIKQQINKASKLGDYTSGGACHSVEVFAYTYMAGRPTHASLLVDTSISSRKKQTASWTCCNLYGSAMVVL
jgi:hypothetical protein